ncbi:hypothetical protein CNMCM5793_006141 [Aspergillus hiratsukae]|uniref:Zinc-binding loop region of homing endonuclease domain-containing protein n=1 Tax=Aspergillus hiratsukae TaxID=1194566 RepID=A0A8H6NZY6_9EURO|nr:hypothetical protein CNMCM5793_006141 [Aspergillus hiratsukae]
MGPIPAPHPEPALAALLEVAFEYFMDDDAGAAKWTGTWSAQRSQIFSYIYFILRAAYELIPTTSRITPAHQKAMLLEATWFNRKIHQECQLVKYMRSSKLKFGFFVHIREHGLHARHRQDIPQGMQASHLCNNRNCFNPAHIEAETPEANNQQKGCPGEITYSVHGHAIVDLCVHRPHCIRALRDDVICCLAMREEDPWGWANLQCHNLSWRERMHHHEKPRRTWEAKLAMAHGVPDTARIWAANENHKNLNAGFDTFEHGRVFIQDEPQSTSLLGWTVLLISKEIEDLDGPQKTSTPKRPIKLRYAEDEDDPAIPRPADRGLLMTWILERYNAWSSKAKPAHSDCGTAEHMHKVIIVKEVPKTPQKTKASVENPATPSSATKAQFNGRMDHVEAYAGKGCVKTKPFPHNTANGWFDAYPWTFGVFQSEKSTTQDGSTNHGSDDKSNDIWHSIRGIVDGYGRDAKCEQAVFEEMTFGDTGYVTAARNTTGQEITSSTSITGKTLRKYKRKNSRLLATLVASHYVRKSTVSQPYVKRATRSAQCYKADHTSLHRPAEGEQPSGKLPATKTTRLLRARSAGDMTPTTVTGAPMIPPFAALYERPRIPIERDITITTQMSRAQSKEICRPKRKKTRRWTTMDLDVIVDAVPADVREAEALLRDRDGLDEMIAGSREGWDTGLCVMYFYVGNVKDLQTGAKTNRTRAIEEGILCFGLYDK